MTFDDDLEVPMDEGTELCAICGGELTEYGLFCANCESELDEHEEIDS